MSSTIITVMVPTSETTFAQGDLLLISAKASVANFWLEKKVAGSWLKVSPLVEICRVAGSFVYRGVSEVGGMLSYTSELTVVVMPVAGYPSEPGLPPAAAALSAALGPTWAELNPGAPEDRPILYEPPHNLLPPEKSFGNKISPWETGAGAHPDSDYWSSSGQTALIPDTPGCGVDRDAFYAYYDHVHATSPRPEGTNDHAVPEPFCSSYYINNQKVDPGQVTWVTRNYGMLSNEGLAVFESSRILGPVGTQTSRDGTDWPLPLLQFPPNKKLIRVALTSANEFALVLLKDLTTGQGQVAVVALEGKCLPFHTLPYIAMPNQGSWSDFKLMGYIDLPGMPDADSIDAASNGIWQGPSDTAGKTLGQLDLTDPAQRLQMDTGEYGWVRIVANTGYFIVSSRKDNKVVVFSMAKTFAFIRQAYLRDFNATIAARATGFFPGTLNSQNSPTLAFSLAATNPTYVLAGRFLDRWMSERDHHKAYFTTQDGMLWMLDTSSLMARGVPGFEFEGNGPIQVIGHIMTGANPTSMCFARFTEEHMPLYATDEMQYPAVNSLLHVCCRGDRSIKTVVTRGGTMMICGTIKGRQIDDPVAVAVTDRANIITICDFKGKKLVGIRMGPLWDRVDPWKGLVGAMWGPGPNGTDLFELSGVLPKNGYPFASCSANVN